MSWKTTLVRTVQLPLSDSGAYIIMEDETTTVEAGGGVVFCGSFNLRVVKMELYKWDVKNIVVLKRVVVQKGCSILGFL